MTLPICARLLFCALVLCPATVAQDPEPLTPEWIRSKACRAVTTLPDVHWLADGSISASASSAFMARFRGGPCSGGDIVKCCGSASHVSCSALLGRVTIRPN